MLYIFHHLQQVKDAKDLGHLQVLLAEKIGSKNENIVGLVKQD